MANMASKVRFPVDILTYLEAEGSGAHVATAGSAALSLDELASYWDDGELAFNQQVAVAINVLVMAFVNEPAVNILTLAANAADGETVTIGTKVYTFQDTLTDVDGNVHVGAAATDSIDNLIGAITLSSGVAGTDYALSMSVHPDVTAAAGAGDTMDVTALVGGTAGNAIAVAESGGDIVWTTSTTFLVGGLDDSDEVYTFAVQVDSEEAFGDDPIVISEFTLADFTNGASAVGNYVLAFTREQVVEMDPDAAWVRMLLTIAGSAPSATYNSRVVPFPSN